MTERDLARHDPRLTLPTAPLPPGSEASLDDLHELRVRIPMALHRQLLSLKILRGKSLADTVSQALDLYFSQAKAARAPAGDEDAADA